MKKVLQGCLGIAAAGLFATSASANMLVNPSFEDAPFGGLEAPVNDAAGWTSFGANFRIQCPTPGTACLEPIGEDTVGAFDGNVVNKNFGSSGVFQEFAASEGQTWNGSVWALNPDNGDQLVGAQVGLAILSWRDAGGGEISADVSNVLTENSPVGMWELLSVSGTAPAGTESVQFLLLADFDVNAPEVGGAPRWDAASLTVVPVPGALLLMGPALLGLAGMGRRKAA